MAEEHGSLADRLWGLTLADFAMRGETGQLTIDSGDKRYCIAFEHGAIVGASSPLAADAAARIALTNHLMTSSQVAEITKRIAAAPERDEVELIAETLTLTLEQAELLRRRVIAQRAARSFALETGTYVSGERVRIPVIHGIAVDVRAVVYIGARMHMSDQRLVAELRKLGTHFTLKRDAFDDLHLYGFTDLERPVLQALRSGAGLPELEATNREVDPRTLQAMIYALATCGAVTCVTVARTPSPASVNFRARPPTAPDLGRAPTALATARTPTPSLGRAPTPHITRTPISGTPVTRDEPPAVSRTKTPTQPPIVVGRTAARPAVARAPTGQPSVPRAPTGQPTVPRAPTGQPAVPRAPTGQPAVPRTMTPNRPVVGRTPTPSPVVGRTPTPSRPVVGRTPTPSPVVGRTPTPGFARTPTPGFARTPTPGLTPTPGRTPTPMDADQRKALAEEAFARGERSLRGELLEPAIVDLARAVELMPNDVDYVATLAWARFCAASDKEGVAETTRKALDRAVYKSTKPATALFYLGRVERMLGRDKEALRAFQEVLALQPTNDAAAAEIRVLEARIAANAKR